MTFEELELKKRKQENIHRPYIHRHNMKLRWSRDFEAYVINSPEVFDAYPCNLYLGEKWLYAGFGLDTNRSNWVGNLSDDWPCIGFGKDLEKALTWLHKTDEPKERTLELWTLTGPVITGGPAVDESVR